MPVMFCALPRCSHQFNHTRHWHPFCSEYCQRIQEEGIKVGGKWPILTRNCDWCHDQYEISYSRPNEKVYFCGNTCSRAAQGLRKYYSLMVILKLNPRGLTANEIAPLGEQHGCPMSSQKASMRLRSLIARKLVVYKEENKTYYTTRRYFLNPDIADLPLQESMKVLDSQRNTHRRDKRRAETTATKENMAN